MKEVLLGIIRALSRRDQEQSTFQTQVLSSLADLQRKAEHNEEMLKELLQSLGKLHKDQNELKIDLETHTKNRLLHAARLAPIRG